MIVKIQLSLFSTHPGRVMLIYDEGFSFWLQQPLSALPEVERLMAGRPKAYFDVEYNAESGTLRIKAEVPKQEW